MHRRNFKSRSQKIRLNEGSINCARNIKRFSEELETLSVWTVLSIYPEKHQINEEIEKLFTLKRIQASREVIAIFNHFFPSDFVFFGAKKSLVLCKFHATLANIRNHFSAAGEVFEFEEKPFSHVRGKQHKIVICEEVKKVWEEEK